VSTVLTRPQSYLSLLSNDDGISAIDCPIISRMISLACSILSKASFHFSQIVPNASVSYWVFLGIIKEYLASLIRLLTFLEASSTCFSEINSHYQNFVFLVDEYLCLLICGLSLFEQVSWQLAKRTLYKNIEAYSRLQFKRRNRLENSTQLKTVEDAKKRGACRNQRTLSICRGLMPIFFKDISMNSIFSGSTFTSSTVSGKVLMPSSLAVFFH